MSIRAGDLNKRVRFERRTAATDEAGTHIGAWQPQFERSARIASLHGSEAVQAARLQGVVTYNITIRSCSQTRTITPEWRAVNTRTGEVYNILTIVNPDERNIALIITATAGDAHG